MVRWPACEGTQCWQSARQTGLASQSTQNRVASLLRKSLWTGQGLKKLRRGGERHAGWPQRSASPGCGSGTGSLPRPRRARKRARRGGAPIAQAARATPGAQPRARAPSGRGVGSGPTRPVSGRGGTGAGPHLPAWLVVISDRSHLSTLGEGAATCAGLAFAAFEITALLPAFRAEVPLPLPLLLARGTGATAVTSPQLPEAAGASGQVNRGGQAPRAGSMPAACVGSQLGVVRGTLYTKPTPAAPPGPRWPRSRHRPGGQRRPPTAPASP
jgi:hypothetical protein